MPASITYRQILIELVEKYGLGKVVPLNGTQSGTTLVLTTDGSPELRGPFSAVGIPVGSPIIVTSETTGSEAVGDRSFVSDWAPSSGTITISPAITTNTDHTEAIIFEPWVKDADRVLEAVKRTLENRIGRWELRPLTYVPDGDLQGVLPASYWTVVGTGTLSYASAQIFPVAQATADQAGATGLNRMLQFVSTSAATVTSTGIRVAPDLGSTGDQWHFWTAVRIVAGTGTVSLNVLDNTATAAIDVNVLRGNSDRTHTQTAIGDFIVFEGTFTPPEDCGEIAFQLEFSATGITAQMTPIIAFPSNAQQFPLPNRIEAEEQVCNFFYAQGNFNPGNLAGTHFLGPITTNGNSHGIYDYGDHLTVSFNFPITQPTFYEEYVNGTAPTVMTDTTTFPMERICKWAYFELMDRLMRDEMHNGPRAENGALSPSRFRPLRNAAYKSAAYSGYEPQLKQVRGRIT